MAENTRELDQIQNDIETLHERSQTNRANISAHEAVCEERYAQIISSIQDLKDELRTVHIKMNEVTELASQGKTSLKTLLWLGAAVAAITAFIATLINTLEIFCKNPLSVIYNAINEKQITTDETILEITVNFLFLSLSFLSLSNVVLFTFVTDLSVVKSSISSNS